VSKSQLTRWFEKLDPVRRWPKNKIWLRCWWEHFRDLLPTGPERWYGTTHRKPYTATKNW